jgi:recombination protein RecR
MEFLPQIIQKLINRFSNLPSIGPRQATRLVFYLINQGKNEILELANQIQELQKIKICSFCFFPHQNQENLCNICLNPERNPKIIMVVEKETDLISLEKTKKFNGRYFIIGHIAKTGVLEEWQKLRLQSLKSYIQKNLGGKADEIILAFNLDSWGNLSANLIKKELNGFALKITRLARGLPTGGEIEFADDETLASALENRE